MENETQKRPGILEVAKKKRHLFLLQKLSQGKHLSRSELKELEKFEDGKLPAGIVDTQEKLAKVLGVSARTVQYWEKDGLPRTKQGFYDLKMVQEWRFSNDKRNKKKGSKKKDIDYESEYRKYKAQLAKMDLEERKGQLVPVRDVEHEVIQEFLRIKQRLLFLPKIIAAQTVGLNIRKVESVCRSRIEEIINGFAQGKFENPQTLKRKTKKKK